MANSAITYKSTKTYVHSLGLSACFRQWRADSHCKYLHGYTLEVVLTFGTDELDYRNWVVDFGSLKEIKDELVRLFDHKTVVAADDPELELLREAEARGIIQITVMDHVGCEKYAEHIYRLVEEWLGFAGYSPRCWIESVEVKEHAGNSAMVIRK